MFTALLLAMAMTAQELPPASDRAPVAFDHFPSREHAFVWRNWQLVPTDRLAQVLDATPDDITRMGRAMGLGEPPVISPEIRKRAYISIIRRNWHLLPYAQLLELLDMTEAELAFTLREDDFLWVKLGQIKPNCAPLKYAPPDDATLEREEAIAKSMTDAFPDGPAHMVEPFFQFVTDLSRTPEASASPPASGFSPRYCSSYFALFGDPLVEDDIDPFPDGYLDRLAAAGVDAVWMHAVLYKLAPFPWDPALSERYEQRLARLNALTERMKSRGMGLYLYMNEPRAMPLAFFTDRAAIKGVTAGDYAALCTSAPEVRAYLVDSIARICEAAPALRGFFTITASENLTSCWSHHRGEDCPRCAPRGPAAVIADVNAAIHEGIQRAGSKAELIAWDWGWQDSWAVDAINLLPKEVAFMSVSEWSIPIERGGIKHVVGEYSISTIGPGPRATKHWAAARARGLKTVAKIQAGNTWELAAVPYIPAVANVAQHAVNLRDANIDGIMLGWSLGGYPSPNLEVVAHASAGGTVDDGLLKVATSRFGAALAPAVVSAWKTCSAAFSEFPYDGGVVYNAPLQQGPANLLFASPTGYSATMVGIPYDDLAAWRGVYPPEVFIAQLTKVADGFDAALKDMQRVREESLVPSPAFEAEKRVIEAAAIHFRSVANQARFVHLRDRQAAAPADQRQPLNDQLVAVVRAERDLAIRLHASQTRDSRIGYESSNHYFYIPADLAEKVINCERTIQKLTADEH